MKNLTICFLVSAFFLLSCKDDEVVNETSLPTAAQTYLNTHFPAITVLRVERDRDDKVTTYEVSLENRIEVEFDASGQVLGIDGQKTERLPDSVIPATILDYTSSRYAQYFIVDWDKNSNNHEVELSNGLELVFDLNGAFLRTDD